MISFVKIARADARVKALYQSLARGVFNIDVPDLQRELDTMQASRIVPMLRSRILLQNFQTKYTSAVLQNQAYRSRCISIKLRTFKASKQLEEYIIALRKHLRTCYAQTLRQYKTAADRDAALDVVLEQPVRLLDKLTNLDAYIDIMVKDLDQAAWTMHALAKVLEISANKLPEI